jgi:hypothetical protein
MKSKKTVFQESKQQNSLFYKQEGYGCGLRRL